MVLYYHMHNNPKRLRFGKEFSMAVNKKLTSILPIIIALYSTHSLGSDDEVLNFLNNKVENKTKLLSDSISRCKKEENTSSELRLDLNVFKTLKVSKNKFMKSLFYFKFRNQELCESKSRYALAFAINQLNFTRSELGLAVSEYSESTTEILYESKKFLQLKIDFMKLDENIRSEFEKQIGKKPFNPHNILEKLDTDLLNK